jgi:hypothetical protein
MREGRVPGFLPSRSGFRFANRFPSQPLLRLPALFPGGLPVGNAANGMCGGMVFAAYDFFCAGLPIPASSEPPAYATPLFRFLVRRLFDSFQLPWGPLRYYRWMASPDSGSAAPGWKTLRQEMPSILKEIEAGRPAALGVIRLHSRNPLHLGRNHQVLAYAYRLDRNGSGLNISIYDPNYPMRDDVTLTLALDHPGTPGAFQASTGEPLRGLFWTPYLPFVLSSLLNSL